MNGDLDDWLVPRQPAATEPTAEQLFARTHGVLRRGVRFPWFGRTAAALALLAVGYGAGLATAPTETRTVIVEVPAAPVPVPEPPPEVVPEPTATQLEMQAELSDDPAEVAALFRQAGDKYLDIERDYPRATRCYRMHLLALNQPNPALQPDDSWLLASLKPPPR